MNIRRKIFGTADHAPEPVIVGSKQPKGAKTDMLDSVPVRRSETRRADTRGGDRHRLADEQVRVTHNGVAREVQLVNLSGGGAMVVADFQPRLWDRVDLHLGTDGVLECAVRWLKGDKVGLEFAHETQVECSADEQAILLREVIARSFPDVELEAPEARAESQAPSGDEQRAKRRHPLIWSGVLHHDYQSNPVRLRNISETGALIQCEVPPRIGSEPLLELGDAGSVFATVSWVVGDQVGLKFQSPFDLGLLARARPEVAPAQWKRPNHLSSAGASDSPWAEEWGRMSIGELREELEGFMKR